MKNSVVYWYSLGSYYVPVVAVLTLSTTSKHGDLWYGTGIGILTEAVYSPLLQRYYKLHSWYSCTVDGTVVLQYDGSPRCVGQMMF